MAHYLKSLNGAAITVIEGRIAPFSFTAKSAVVGQWGQLQLFGNEHVILHKRLLMHKVLVRRSNLHFKKSYFSDIERIEDTLILIGFTNVMSYNGNGCFVSIMRSGLIPGIRTTEHKQKFYLKA